MPHVTQYTRICYVPTHYGNNLFFKHGLSFKCMAHKEFRKSEIPNDVSQQNYEGEILVKDLTESSTQLLTSYEY